MTSRPLWRPQLHLHGQHLGELNLVRTIRRDAISTSKSLETVMYANRYQLSLVELHRARAAVDRGDFNGAVPVRYRI